LVRTNDKAWSVSAATLLIASTWCGINRADHISNKKFTVVGNRAYYINKEMFTGKLLFRDIKLKF
jgi:hypothetical protein